MGSLLNSVSTFGQSKAARSLLISGSILMPATAKSESKLCEAIHYTLTRWDGLTLFLDGRRVDLDNNAVERSIWIRPLALSRKNALFAGSDKGDDSAVIATLIENCKLSAITPHAWLSETLTKLAAGHQANTVG